MSWSEGQWSHFHRDSGTETMVHHPRGTECNLGLTALPYVAQKEAVNHPDHYNSSASGVECITVVEHMTFNIGNAVKYLWRAGDKGSELTDLQKARWYVQREFERLGGQPAIEPCKHGSQWGECVLANGHENWQGSNINDRPQINHIDRYGQVWNVGGN